VTENLLIDKNLQADQQDFIHKPPSKEAQRILGVVEYIIKEDKQSLFPLGVYLIEHMDDDKTGGFYWAFKNFLRRYPQPLFEEANRRHDAM